MSLVVAAELLPGSVRLIAARREKGQPPALVAGTVFDLERPDAHARLREFRREHGLPAAVRLVFWPERGDAGVTPIERVPERCAVAPAVVAVRERVKPLVRAGYRIAAVSLPDPWLGRAAFDHGAALAALVSLHPSVGCLTFARRGQASHVPSYLAWRHVETNGHVGHDGLLERYRLAAAIAPHVRRLVETAPDGTQILVCGSLSGLRATIMPLVEELDREVEVLDVSLPGLTDGLSAEASAKAEALAALDDPAAWQVVWAAAAA